MFVYCLNNPLSHIDSTGTWTVSLGIGANVTVFMGVSIGIGVSFDGKGNIEFQWNYSLPNRTDSSSMGTIDAGAAVQLQYTGKKTVDDLHGTTTYIGGSAGNFYYGTLDVVSCAPAASHTEVIDGVQLSAGVGYGVDVHVNQTVTKPLYKTSWKKIWWKVSSLWRK